MHHQPQANQLATVLNGNGEDVDKDWVENSNYRLARDIERQTQAKAKHKTKANKMLHLSCPR
jgi:hypothetical protein